MKKAKAKKPKPGPAADPVAAFDSLSDAEKERVWESFNRPISRAETRTLSPAERRQWRRVKRGTGRPKVGAGAKVVSLSVERRLLERADAYAKEHGLNRSELVSRALTLVLQPAEIL